jgi:periplasmic mercuric ion binding protein
MKHIIILLFAFFATQTNTFAKGNITTDTLAVKGNCGECKTRIQEAALDVKGVKAAVWNKKTKQLVVTYNNSKVSKEKIEKAIAAVGHDANQTLAPEKTYLALPKCCQYKTGTCAHE